MNQKILALLAATVSSLAFVTGCGKSDSPAPPKIVGTALTNAVAALAPEVSPVFAMLKGKWERPDGGYVLEIRAVAADGKADAGYFNPSSINVERAQIYSEEGATKVFVILRDANYPGCTYKLNYDPKADQLYGQYFQASMQQTYDVSFQRMK